MRRRVGREVEARMRPKIENALEAGFCSALQVSVNISIVSVTIDVREHFRQERQNRF